MMITHGINRADKRTPQLSFNTNETLSLRKCVFLSHKKEDEKAAVQIGDYLTKKIGVDIYLDLYDMELKQAVSKENDEKIVASIQKGLSTSTHLLCLVSDKTRVSWWVPYEIGFAAAHNKEIATLKLKGTEDIPSFLNTNLVLCNQHDFYRYVQHLTRYGGLFSKENNHVVTELNEFIELG